MTRIASLLNRRKESEALYSNAEGFWTVSLNTLFQGLHLPGQAASRTVAEKRGSVQDALHRLDQVLTDLEGLGKTASGAPIAPPDAKAAARQLALSGDRLQRLATAWQRGTADRTQAGHNGDARSADTRHGQRRIQTGMG